MSEASTETTRIQKNHRSQRIFTSDPIAERDIQELMEVACWTPSSVGQQRVSVIRITDPSLRRSIAHICNQAYHATAAEFWVFVTDLYRNYKIAQNQHVDTSLAATLDKWLQGVSDALLMCQNVSVAAESMGLGTVVVGSIHNNYQRLTELLKLPPYTFPTIALSMGHTTDKSQQKPRLPKHLQFMENGYKKHCYSEQELASYNKIMRNYYDQRDKNPRDETFTHQVLRFVADISPERESLIHYLKAQGFVDMSKDSR